MEQFQSTKLWSSQHIRRLEALQVGLDSYGSIKDDSNVHYDTIILHALGDMLTSQWFWTYDLIYHYGWGTCVTFQYRTKICIALADYESRRGISTETELS